MFYNHFQGEEVGTWEGRTVWQYLRGLRFSLWGGLLKGECPEGSYTDLASVPRHFHLYDLFGGKCNREAAAHDMFYREGAVLQFYPEFLADFIAKYGTDNPVCQWLENKEAGMVGDIPRHVGDLAFKQLMIEQNRCKELYLPMYSAVRVGGSGSYHKYKVMDALPFEEEVGCGDVE